MQEKELITANCVNVLGCGMLILGPSASGKSDLTLRLLSAKSHFLDEPCALISDDQTLIWQQGGQLFGSAPATIAGRLEVRGVGIVKFDHLQESSISFAVELVKRDKIERIPDLSAQKAKFAGIEIPKLTLCSFEVSACEKLFAYVLAVKKNALANEI